MDMNTWCNFSCPGGFVLAKIIVLSCPVVKKVGWFEYMAKGHH